MTSHFAEATDYRINLYFLGTSTQLGGMYVFQITRLKPYAIIPEPRTA